MSLLAHLDSALPLPSVPLTHSTVTSLEPLFRQATAVLGALLFSIILISGLLYLLRHQALRPGITTLVLTLLIGSLTLMREGRELIPSAILAGLIGDLALLCMPTYSLWKLRLWCFGLPFIYYALVILTLNLTTEVWWSVHMQAGLPVITGIAGLLTSLVILGNKQ